MKISALNLAFEKLFRFAQDRDESAQAINQRPH